jgi:hypothetical protein
MLKSLFGLALGAFLMFPTVAKAQAAMDINWITDVTTRNGSFLGYDAKAGVRRGVDGRSVRFDYKENAENP